MKKHLFFLLILGMTFLIPAQASLFDNAGDEDMPPTQDEAFQFAIDVASPTALSARFTVAPGNYVYRDKIKFEIKADTPIQILPYQLPESKTKDDEIFGPTEVYLQDINIPLSLNRSQVEQTVTFVAHYQGCSETFNICYPPTKKSFELLLPPYIATDINSSSSPVANQPLSEQDQLAKSLAQDNLFKVLLSFFGIGILLAFTPCVFPMIPILSSIIVGEGDNITTRRAFTLSLVYVLAMSVTYTIAGLLTGLLGANIQTMLQNPWVIGSFSALFVILSLSMFGLYELQLPHALQSRLHQISHQQKGGKLVGVALMGLFSGLIVGPCLAPPLAGALIFIGQQGDPLLGASALFAMSMGMGLPLLVIGTSAGSLLPKAGGWMDAIKAIFGVLMLGLAIWLLERIIPGWVALLLWGSLLIVSAVYLGALNTLSLSSSGWEKLFKGFGLIIMIYGALLLIGSASGSQNVWQPLQGFASMSGTSTPSQNGIKFKKINNLSDLEQQLAQSSQPVMLDLYADWCVECKTMEMTTFRDPTVVATLADTLTLKLDMTDNNDEHKALLKQFGIFGPPTILFFDPQGNEYKQFRLVGTMNPSDFTAHLTAIPSIGK
jgi:thiol:disulfide interchange protein DsbD